MSEDRFHQLRREALAGKLTRRQVLRRGMLLGLSAPAIAALLAACGSSTSSSSSASSAASSSSSSSSSSSTSSSAATASSGGSTPSTGGAAASPSASAQAQATSSGPPTKRGEGGQLKLLWWEAPTILNGHLSQGTKDYDASRVVSEPLADFDANGNLVPILADHAPSLDNGEVAKDGKSVTWKLKQGVKWSDGQPFTSADVKFTYDFVINKDTAAVTIASYLNIDSIDTPDDFTVTIHFKAPAPNWANAFCSYNGYILPQHILKDFVGKNARNAPFNLKPTGTNAFKVVDFVPGDHVDYTVNDNYRDPTKPFFSTVNLKGGGDATSAARAAIQLGEVDYAWNLQVTADILKSLETPSSPGQLVIYPGNGTERILVNHTDPNKTVDGQKSHLGTPHPFQSDINVRKAYSMAIDYQTMQSKLYGPAGVATANVLVAPTRFVSKNTSQHFDIAGANKLLDDNGYAKGSDGTRAKNGVKLSVVYQTTVNALRQQEQEIVKNGFQQIGVSVTLKTIDASVFFSSAAGNTDTAAHFYADLEMFTNTAGNPYPINYMQSWWGDTSNVAQKENDWAGNNYCRWVNTDYDNLYNQALTEMDPAKQPPIFIQMNDLVVNNVAVINLIARNGVSGANRKLQNLDLSTWASSELWNIANWTMKS